MENYIARAALRDEANEGWIWVDGLPSRTIVKVTNRESHCWSIRPRRSVVCEVREIDENFLDHYNQEPRFPIPKQGRQPTLVLSHWYRAALGGFHTTEPDNVRGRVKLAIKPMRLWGWRSIRAACHHPDIVVRLGTRLGVLGTWLGVLGVWFSSPWPPKLDGAWSNWPVFAALVLSGIAFYGCCGPRRLPLSNGGV